MQAILEIPTTDEHSGFRMHGLSDDTAMTYGKRFAETLSERDGFVVVTLSDGTVKTICNDTHRNELVFGTLIME